MTSAALSLLKFCPMFPGSILFFAGWSWFFSVSDTHSKISWVETTPSLKTRLLPRLPAACPRLLELCPKGVFDISDHGPMDHVHSYWKLPFFMGNNTSSMAIFHSYVENYQRVVPAPKKSLFTDITTLTSDVPSGPPVKQNTCLLSSIRQICLPSSSFIIHDWHFFGISSNQNLKT